MLGFIFAILAFIGCIFFVVHFGFLLLSLFAPRNESGDGGRWRWPD